MYERLLSIMSQVGQPRVLLVGDYMLDRYLYGFTDRISPEAPVLVLNVTERQDRPGGAGSVATDLAVLGAQVDCIGTVGEDDSGGQLLTLLSEIETINIDGLVTVAGRPTTAKQRVIGLAQHRHQQQLMRIDEEDLGPVGEAVRTRLLKCIEDLLPACDVVCVEDYNKGLLNGTFCRQVIESAAHHGKRVIVDPAAIADCSRYHGAWLIKPNRRELALATGIAINGQDSWREACAKLSQDHAIGNIVVTLDKEGAYLYQGAQEEHELVPTRPRNVYDVTGAGDMVLAMLGLLVGGRYESLEAPQLGEIVYLANVAGGLEVERYGCVGIRREEISAELVREGRLKTGKLRMGQALLQELQWCRQQEQKIVFTNGCFDILHPGHIDLLTFARKQGDVLIVAINSDQSVRALKGPDRPINRQEDRAGVLGALEPVDYVTIFDQETPEELIEAIGPDVLIKGADWSGNVVGQQSVEARGGKVVLMPLTQGHSTTGIIERMGQKQNHPSQKSGEVT